MMLVGLSETHNNDCEKCTHTTPGPWIPAIPAGMTEWRVLLLARHPGMDAGIHRPRKAMVSCSQAPAWEYLPSSSA